MDEKKTLLTANARIFKPDMSGFFEPGETFEADLLPDKGAYLIAGGHVTSSEGPPPKAEEDDARVSELEEKVQKLEKHTRKVNAYVAKLPDDQKKAFKDAMKAEEQAEQAPAPQD